jgi:transcriptional regulator with GAF, ATPase, and Fis domain
MHALPLQLVDIVSKHSDTQTMASTSLPHFVTYMGADNGSLLLLSGNEVTHKVLATKETFTEVSAHKVRTVLTEGLAGWSLRHRQGGLASDAELDERWISLGDTSIASALVVPMISRGAVIGLLSFHHSTKNFFREVHLAKAAEVAGLVAPHFDLALQTEASMAALATLCQSAESPSVVLDWHGKVQVINLPMKALDIVWEGSSYAQSLLPRELGAPNVNACDWPEWKPLSTLPWQARSVPVRGVGVWIQLNALKAG